jgi:hypothetical protein
MRFQLVFSLGTILPNDNPFAGRTPRKLIGNRIVTLQ